MAGDENASNLEHRLQKIMFLLKKRERVNVNELSEEFGVSKVTIRSDLNELERQGLVVRSYGGAALVQDSRSGLGKSGQDSGGSRKESVSAGSYAIAKVASELIKDGDVIFLDSSIESRLIADRIKRRRNLTVITANLAVAYWLARAGRVALYLAGGQVVRPMVTISDEKDEWPFPDIHLTKAFAGAWGATREAGFTDQSKDETILKKLAFARAQERIVLLHSKRWERTSLSTFASFDQVDTVVTDADADETMVALFRGAGVEIVRAAARAKTESIYAEFEGYREFAYRGLTYRGTPGRGKRIAFSNGKREEPFCARLEQSVIEQASLAGFSEENVLILDNAYDPDLAVENARRALEWGTDLLIEFNTDARSNHVIADLCREASVPILALEGTVPAAPFVGANNWRAGTFAGDFAINLINEKFGGWSRVDGVLLVQMSTAGEIILFRTEGFAASIEAVIGDAAEEKFFRIEGGNEYATAHSAVASVAKRLIRNGRYVLTAVNPESMQGALDALMEAEIFSPERFVTVSHGYDVLGREQMKKGLVDGSIRFFPERYGSALIPAACVIIEGKPIPPYTYVDVAMVTREDFDQEERSGT